MSQKKSKHRKKSLAKRSIFITFFFILRWFTFKWHTQSLLLTVKQNLNRSIDITISRTNKIKKIVELWIICSVHTHVSYISLIIVSTSIRLSFQIRFNLSSILLFTWKIDRNVLTNKSRLRVWIRQVLESLSHIHTDTYASKTFLNDFDSYVDFIKSE